MAVLSNGDLVTACADASARVWTGQAERQAPQQEREAFQQALAVYQQASEPQCLAACCAGATLSSVEHGLAHARQLALAWLV